MSERGASERGAWRAGRRSIVAWRAGLARTEGTVDRTALSDWLLRAGLVFVFAYAAASSFADPEAFERYMPAVLPASWTTAVAWLFAAYEVGLVVALLTRRYVFAASVLSAVTLAAIVLLNPSAFNVLFRNVAIVCASLALAAGSRTPRRAPCDAAPRAAGVTASFPPS